MKLHLGSGSVRIEGFTNVDIRKTPEVDIVGHAGNLPVREGAAEIIFGHAVFEHIFLGHQLATLREWRRVLAPSGRIIMLGIPDFRAIADLYLRAGRGIVGERFDLHNVYRYTHGEPEHATPPVWAVWQPSPRSQAPPGYIFQLHKGIFDADYLYELCKEAGFSVSVFNYSYPGEEHSVNLGLIATLTELSEDAKSDIRGSLAAVPDVERFINLQTIAAVPMRHRHDGLVGYAVEMASSHPDSLATRVVRRMSRMVSGRA